MDTIRVRGMVLSSMPIGEYDRRLLILSKELGRVSVFARGARRQSSTLLAASRPFAAGSFQLRQGRDSFSLTAASIQDYFEELTSDALAMAYGCYFAEATGFCAAENADGTELLNLLYVSLKALEGNLLSYDFIRLIFELRLFAVDGEYPQVFECLKCRKQLTSGWLFVGRGSCCCDECRQSISGAAIRLDESAIYTLQYVATVPLNRLFSFRVSDDVKNTLKELADVWRRRYQTREFKSLQVLEDMQGINSKIVKKT